ncbi:P2Y purinoceptor 2 [Procambarus clarkii]|uniref:P2Y purinoceptor 2 n=1 Tax=Procambarus clarkii TaxID=6728 RepID=UPI001E67257A|nr:melatonin receptor type 1B-B-like [Procambarus clarkii]
MPPWNTTDAALHDPSLAPAVWALTLGLVMGGLVAVSGSVCNLGAVAVLLKEASRRRSRQLMVVTADSILLLQLAVVDLLYCSVTLPLLMATYLQPQFHPPAFCAAAGFIRIANSNVEFNTLGLVALERFYNIKRGRSSGGLFSVRLTRLYCSGLWVLALGFQLPFIRTGQYGFNERTHRCDIMVGWWTRCALVMGEAVLPLAVILTCYLAILRQVRRSKALMAKYMDGHHPRSSGEEGGLVRRYRVASRTLLGLVILYAVCILPIVVLNIAGEFGRWKEVGIVFHCFYWLQYIANTLIYVMSNVRYRMALRGFLRGIFASRKANKKRITAIEWDHFNSSYNIKKSIDSEIAITFNKDHCKNHIRY